TLFGFVATLSMLHTVLTMLVLASAVPAMLAHIALSRRFVRSAEKTTPMIRRQLFYANLLSNVQAVKEIRLYDSGGFLRDRMLAELRHRDEEQAGTDRRAVAVQIGLSTMSAAIAGVALGWGVFSASRGDLTIGDVTLLIAAVGGVQGALTTIVSSLASGHQASLLLTHYLRLVDDGPDLPRPVRPVPPPALSRGIEFDHVWFRYADDHDWVLRGIDLHIPAGTSAALVGVNGSGKSTLVKLLCRFYDPQRGAIRWDGVDLRDMHPAELRRRIAILFQDFMRYDLSAAENIAIGDLAALAQPQRVEAAARLADVHETLARLPRGYETALTRLFLSPGDRRDGNTGVLLSGGQWQRLALARTLLRDSADLLILDEPNAGLDPVAEHELQLRLRQHRTGRTTVVISHRLSAWLDADLIVVLRDGVVVEQGTHQQLLNAGGEYLRLVERQVQHSEPPGRESADDPVPLGDQSSAARSAISRT
ncbi:MAG TPA: ABC transporter ATP-binding protein, partial [Micromonosporaceae bacterium]